MAHGDISGRAFTSTRNPRAFGVCDDCGRWFNLDTLLKQMDYIGANLEWTGQLVCRDCNDDPQDQARPVQLPPDPVPKANPRPENLIASQSLQGFSQFVLFTNPADGIAATKAQVLAALAGDIAVPTPLTDRSGKIAGGAQTIMPANGARSWMAIYNAASPALAISLGSTLAWGALTSLMIGAGECLVASGAGTVSLGAILGLGLIPGVSFYAWEF